MESVTNDQHNFCCWKFSILLTHYEQLSTE